MKGWREGTRAVRDTEQCGEVNVCRHGHRKAQMANRKKAHRYCGTLVHGRDSHLDTVDYWRKLMPCGSCDAIEVFDVHQNKVDQMR